MTDILTINDLSYKLNLTTVLKDITCSIPAGKIVGLLGANGAGKTTLMRLISGVAKNYRGEIKVAGQSAVTKRKQLVSFSHQLDAVDDHTRLEQIAHFYELVYPDFSSDEFQQLAQFLELNLHDRLSKLSKGNRKKFVVAMTLSRRAKLYLLDEPFNGIDVMSRKKIIASILKWKPVESTILISDHHVGDIANILDSVTIIKDQKIVAQKDADTIRAQFGESIEDYYESIYTKEEQND